MANFKHKDKQEVSREEAAELLTAIADALRTGDDLELVADSQRVSVPVGDLVLMEREYETKHDRVEIKLELSWPMPARSAPASPAASAESAPTPEI